jgi:PHD/YefM family antitoxin component YafN of YafNO toxin-antitoxin module
MTQLVTNISDFRKNPNLQVEEAGGLPFAVITNNRPSFYVLPPELFEEFEQYLEDKKLAVTVKRRLSERDKFVSADITKL